ncbi:hypothetical protein D8674_010345 [Pyrus ussuriensis x Pyrus communis]|uniref:Uncharacterized protein n=1 Tax=Pyrus ussuriensis x Pyrus communis TaxID=2448454 RepID=A0A5N5FP80_9ROSA|nr:hypothetical protein D8674_010345 [Pyrus ussuriensis x Pyrus communis]
MVSTVQGNRDGCEDNLGPCGNDCNERCQAKHGGFDEQPQGTCHPECRPVGCVCVITTAVLRRLQTRRNDRARRH